MLPDLISIVTIILSVVGIGGGLWGLFKGLHEFRNNQTLKREDQTLKRQEILFPLIKDFENDQNIEYATKILDDFILEKEDNWKNPDPKYYYKSNLDKILRNHFVEGVSDPGEQKIRESFDTLLFFYGKLGYLLHLGLLKEKELLFFNYYIDKILEKTIPKINDENAIIHYAITYEFQMFALLLHELGRAPPSLMKIIPQSK